MLHHRAAPNVDEQQVLTDVLKHASLDIGKHSTSRKINAVPANIW